MLINIFKLKPGNAFFVSQPSILHFLSHSIFFTSNYIIIKSMQCRCGNYSFCQTLTLETCEYEECKSSTNSLHHLFQIKDEGDYNVDEEMRECCEQLVYKKYSTCKAMSLEKADSSDTKNNNAAIDNEGNVAITCLC